MRNGIRRVLLGSVIWIGVVAAGTVRPVASFETEHDTLRAAQCKPVRVEQHATNGTFALRLHCKGSGKDSWPGIYVDAKNDMDWTGRELVFDVFVAGDKSSHLNLRLDGADGIFVFSSVTLKPGANQDVTISVETMAGGKVDITRIKSVFLYYSCPREDQTFFLDHVRLRVPDAGDAGRIASFESDEDNPFVASNCTVERTNAVKTHGEFGLRVQVPGNDKDTWPGLSWHPKNGDWSKHESLLMDVFVEGDAEMRLSCRIDTEDRANVFNSWPLKPGWNTDVMVNLKGQSKALNLNAVLHFYPYASIPRKTMAFVLDNLRFAKIPDPKTKLQRLAYVERNAGLPPNDEEKERGCQLFSRSYLHHVFPNSVPDNRLEKLALFVAQGEREPLTFSLHGLRDLRKVTINVAPASGPNGATLPPETWEIGRVECRDRRTFYSSTAYVADMPTYIEPLAEPLSVSSGTTQRFWLTLNTPPDARPGLYSGQISITIDGATTDLPLSVRVLPFSLPEAQGKFFGPYYRVWQNVPDKRQAIAADLADMRRQGMTSVGLCMGVGKSSYVVENGEVTFHFKDDTWFEWFMDAYRDLHFPSDLVLLSDSGREAARQVGKPGEAAYDQVYIRFHKALIAEAKQRGWPRMYVQPYDEPGYHDEAERLSNIAHLKLLKKAGIPTEQDGPPDSYFVGRAGPDSDMWTCNGRIVVPDVLEKARKAGKKVLVYNCDVEHYRPETGRWNYGLFCWRHRLDGSYNWEYRGGYGSLDSDFDGKYGVWVAHYLPGENTRGGPATGWEGFREGLDDYRYLMLLEELISRGGKTGGEAAKLAVEAEAFLAYLREHLDDAAGLRGRSTWAAKLSREEALKAGLSLRDKQARTVVVGPLRQPNGLDFSEYDAIRWMVARRALRLHQTLAGQVVPPGPSFRPQPVSQRFRILTDEIDSGTSQLYSRPTVSIPELAATPVIDGEIDGDPAWTNATTVSMVLSDGTGKSEMPTLVHLGRRDNTLYLGFVCHENRTRYMTAKVTTPEGNVWTDDCVEVFIDARNTQKKFHQIVLNCLGVVRGYASDGTDWKPGLRAKARILHDKNRWLAELAIPIGDLRMGSSIGFNLCRERRPVEAYELSSWSVTGGSFGVPKRFGIAVLKGSLEAARGSAYQIAMRLSPSWALTTRKEMRAYISLAALDGLTEQEKVTVTLGGNGVDESFDLPTSTSGHRVLAVATADLPPGLYTLTARLGGARASTVTASADFMRGTAAD